MTGSTSRMTTGMTTLTAPMRVVDGLDLWRMGSLAELEVMDSSGIMGSLDLEGTKEEGGGEVEVVEAGIGLSHNHSLLTMILMDQVEEDWASMILMEARVGTTGTKDRVEEEVGEATRMSVS